MDRLYGRLENDYQQCTDQILTITCSWVIKSETLWFNVSKVSIKKKQNSTSTAIGFDLFKFKDEIEKFKPKQSTIFRIPFSIFCVPQT